jgi:ATP phosphoribosyltransferase
MKEQPERIKIAAQKSGRFAEPSMELLSRCGLNYSKGPNQLICYGGNMPVDVLLVRDDDIPDLIHEDICDLGVVGLNVIKERRLGMIANGVESTLISVNTTVSSRTQV